MFDQTYKLIIDSLERLKRLSALFSKFRLQKQYVALHGTI